MPDSAGMPFMLIDAFTDRPFAGNPAAVYVLPAWREDDWLQRVAREMNQSETAFLVRNAAGYDLRWFTPVVEVDLCGHATLASAHALWQERLVAPGDMIQFSTRSGILKAARRGDEIELDFPRVAAEPAEPPPGLAEALGARPVQVRRNRFDYLVEVQSESILRGLTPDFGKLKALPVRGVIVTSLSSQPVHDFVSRFFAPAVGVNEDPVTGSAHCCLGDYWHGRLGKTEFSAYQASARGGLVRVRVAGDRVFLGGKAVTAARGNLLS
jgi:PhzF family phenazine biosynthesis protein